MAKRTAAGIQADIAKGAFRPHTALSNVALAYYLSCPAIVLVLCCFGSAVLGPILRLRSVCLIWSIPIIIWSTTQVDAGVYGHRLHHSRIRAVY